MQIDVGLDKVDKILHVADIHIRKLHRIVTKLMLQVTMKDKCLSEPSLQVLKRIESSKDIEQWVQAQVKYFFIPSYDNF